MPSQKKLTKDIKKNQKIPSPRKATKHIDAPNVFKSAEYVGQSDLESDSQTNSVHRSGKLSTETTLPGANGSNKIKPNGSDNKRLEEDDESEDSEEDDEGEDSEKDDESENSDEGEDGSEISHEKSPTPVKKKARYETTDRWKGRIY